MNDLVRTKVGSKVAETLEWLYMEALKIAALHVPCTEDTETKEK